MVLLPGTFYKTLRRRTEHSKKYQVWWLLNTFNRVLGLDTKIHRSQGVATLNPDSLEAYENP